MHSVKRIEQNSQQEGAETHTNSVIGEEMEEEED